MTLQKKPDWVLGAEKDGEKAGADNNKTADDAADVASAAPDASAAADASAVSNNDNQPAAAAAEVPEVAEPQV